MEKESKKKRKLLNLNKFELKIDKNNYYAFYYNNFSQDHIKIQKYVFRNIKFNNYNLHGGKSPLSVKIIKDENLFFKNLSEQDISRILVVQENLIYMKKIDFNVKQVFLLIFFCFLNTYNMTNVYYYNNCIKEKI